MNPTRILFELRPALDGYAGIPQETRLLFRGLSSIDGIATDGLIQSSNQVLVHGLPSPSSLCDWKEDERVNRLARVVVSMQGDGTIGPMKAVRRSFHRYRSVASMLLRAMLGGSQRLSHFAPSRFEDFIWRSMFSKTLSPEDFETVTLAQFRIAEVPWNAAHAAALLTRAFGVPLYPRLDTRGYDILLAETPFPGRVDPSTRLVVRYHDAVPILFPHTIINRAFHQASHYEALRRNVRDSAWFVCVSEASRRDLISIFPAARDRSLTIPNMVSHRYFEEERSPEQVPDILKTRKSLELTNRSAPLRRLDERKPRTRRAPEPPQYLLCVNTLEPRKNHLTLLSAWEQVRAAGHPNLELVLVGTLGWESDAIVHKLLPWVASGTAHVLEEVPSVELRLLYRHARVTVCPSFAEGFGFSGVEAMRSGGVVAASDIPVHREIYGDAAEYFNPYSVESVASVLMTLLDASNDEHRSRLAARGTTQSRRYLPENVLPEWQRFVNSMTRDT